MSHFICLHMAFAECLTIPCNVGCNAMVSDNLDIREVITDY